MSVTVARWSPTGSRAGPRISLYERAVAADKKDAAARLNLGLLLRENGQERAGNKDVLRAIALDPTLQDPSGAVDSNGPAR